MTLNVTGILAAVESHALRLGVFDRVGRHEPKNAPGNGLTCAIWVDRIEPARGNSGLAETTARITLNVRVYTSMVAEPQDSIDPSVMEAVDALMGAYSGDFDLGGLVRDVDLLGQTGAPLQAQAGYLTIGSTMYRVMTVTLPVLVNDLWEQVS